MTWDFHHLFAFLEWCGTQLSPLKKKKKIPRPLLFLTISPAWCKILFAKRLSSYCKNNHALYSFASFYPSDSFSEMSDYWKASNTKGEHKAKVGLFICLGPLGSQEIWNKRALLNPRERACFSVNALTFSLALTCFKAYIWHKLICRVFSHFPSAAGAN